jgi:predicted  nucleic acid-binding Zn-ribbon protein
MTSLNLLSESVFDSVYTDNIYPYTENNVSITNLNIVGDCNVYTKTEVDNELSQINNDISNLDNRITATENDITLLSGRMTTAEQNINSLDTRVTTAEQNIDSLDTRMTTTEGNITTINTNISTINTNISNIDSRLSNAENDINILQTDVTQLTTDLNDLEIKEQNDVLTLQNSINNINTSINTINTTLSTLNNDLITIQSDIQNIEGDITTINGTITTITNNITQLQTNLSNLTTQVNNISSTLSTVQNNITLINNNINSINNNITNINNTISSIQSDIQSIHNNIQSIVTDIQNLTNDLNNFKNSQNSTNNSFQSSINSINSNVSSLQTTVTGLVTAMAVAQAQIVGLIASVATNSASITTLQGQVSTLQADSLQQAGQIQALENGYIQLESEMAVEQGHSAWNILQWSAVLGSAIAGVGTTTYLITTNMINEPQNPTNRYFTEARSRASISALDSTINYNNSTGKFAVNSSLFAPSSTVSSQWSNITNGIEYNNNVNIGGTLKTNTLESLSTSLNIGNNSTTQNVNIACGSSIQTVNIGNNGTTGQTNINIGGPNDTVTISGTLNYIDTTNLEVKDNQIIINKGGSAGSGGNSGLYIEEGGSNTAYIKLNGTRNGFALKSPLQSEITIDQSSHNPVTIGTANGLSLNNQIISLSSASSSTNGALLSSDWTTFNNKQNALNFSLPLSNSNNNLSLLYSPIFTLASGVLSMFPASSSQNGYLTSSDWSTFNNKQNSLTFSGPLANNNNTVSITQANSTTNGFLSSSDWNTFNNKVSSQWTSNGSNINYTNGNVSIGTTNTNGRFYVVNNANGLQTVMTLENSWGNPFTGTRTTYRGYGGDHVYIDTPDDGNYNSAYVISTNTGGDGVQPTEKFRIRANGNIGINNSLPFYRLDVNGDINATGLYRINGNQISTNNVLEGTNLYFTQQRARNSISVGSANMFYNTSLGLLACDGYTQAETTAFLNTKLNKAGDTMTGHLILNNGLNARLFIGQAFNADFFTLDVAGESIIRSRGSNNPNSILYFQPNSGILNRYAIASMDNGDFLVGNAIKMNSTGLEVNTPSRFCYGGINKFLNIQEATNNLYLDFKTNEGELITLYDTRIQSSGGVSGTLGQGVLSHFARSHRFFGNVGINLSGAVEPNGRLCLNGRGIADSKLPVQLHCNTNGEAWYAINYGSEASPDYNFLIGCKLGNAELRQTRNFDMIFSTNDSERMRILSGGNIGIGCSPLSRLSLSQVTTQSNTPGQIVGEIAFQGFNRTVRSSYIQCVSQSWDDQGGLAFGTSSSGTGATEKMRILENGNVGIGTNNPGQRLTVEGGDILVNGTGRSVYVGGITNSSQPGTRLHYAANETYFDTVGNALNFRCDSGSGNSIRMRLLNDGRLGIGLTNPAHLLHVMRTGGSTADISFNVGEISSGKYIGIASNITNSAYTNLSVAGDSLLLAGPADTSNLVVGVHNRACMRFNSSNNIQFSNMNANNIIPWIAFNHFVMTEDGRQLMVAAPSIFMNGTPYSKSGSTADFGSVKFYCPTAGTYRFNICFFHQFNQGIARFVITDSNTNATNTQDIDLYSTATTAKTTASFAWAVSLSAGNHTISLTTNGRNASSQSFFLSFLGTGINYSGPI